MKIDPNKVVNNFTFKVIVINETQFRIRIAIAVCLFKFAALIMGCKISMTLLKE